MKIDMHAHFIPRDCYDMTDRKGHNYGPTIAKDSPGGETLIDGGLSLGPVTALMSDPETRLHEMDRMRMDMQVVCMSPLSIDYSIDSEDAISFCQRQNNGIAELVTAYPDRFLGMATVPMQDMSKAVPELERAVQKLGLKGVEILSNVNGKDLDEPEFLPFYRKAQELDTLIYVHPHKVLGSADRMRKYWLAALFGNPVDTSLAIASIIFGGVLEKFPRLRFLFSHAGGCVPYVIGRWDHGYRASEICRTIPKPPSEYFKLISDVWT